MLRGARTNEIAMAVADYRAQFNSEVEFVDGTGGYGAGVVDAMLQMQLNPVEVAFNAKASSDKYFNKRSEMWFEMANWVKRGGALPKCVELRKELLAPTFGYSNGKFQLESKDQIKKRLGFSPDKADALALTFALPEMMGSSMGVSDDLVFADDDNIGGDAYDPFGA
jgi:hypothetical protein